MHLSRRGALRAVTVFLAVNLPLSLVLGCLYPAATPGIGGPLGWTFVSTACTYAFPPATTTVRIVMAVSMLAPP